jgi:hypothetical protein
MADSGVVCGQSSIGRECQNDDDIDQRLGADLSWAGAACRSGEDDGAARSG